MKKQMIKCTRWQLPWRSRLICVPAAMLLFVVSAQAQPAITAASNPVVIPNGQASGATTITWKAAPDYTYSEIYLSVDNGQWSEFAKGPDGSKPATLKLGSSYTFRMMVYEGQQGTPKIISTITVTTVQGSPPPPPSGGIGGRDVSDTISDPSGRDMAYLLAIRNVRVEPGPRHVMIRFHGPPNQVPFVAIGRAAPVMKNGEWVFGDNLVGGGFVGATTNAAEKAKGEYTFSSAASTTNISNGLEPGATYYYNIIIPAGAGQPPYQDTDKFTMLREAADATLEPIGGGQSSKFAARCPQGQLLTGFELLTGDDVDAIRLICVTPYGPADVGPNVVGGETFGGNGFFLGTVQLLCPRDAPIVTGMYVYAIGRTEIVDRIHLFCGTAATTQAPSEFPAAVFDGTGGKQGSGLQAGFVGKDEGTQRCPAGLVAVGINGRSGIWLDAVGLICGAPTLTPGNSENTGTTSSALTREPVKTLGRVKVPPGTTPSPPISICEAARRARARNNAAAPGLEAQCRAAGAAGEIPPKAPVKALGRVELPLGTTPNPPRPICDVAREARARNNAAAPGLEAQCRAVLAAKGAAIADTDEIVAAARVVETDVLYKQGFDIATGIFGDPALGALGNTATGPGSLGIRDSLTAAGQRGFNASVKLHLSRNYKP